MTSPMGKERVNTRALRSRCFNRPGAGLSVQSVFAGPRAPGGRGGEPVFSAAVVKGDRPENRDRAAQFNCRAKLLDGTCTDRLRPSRRL